MFDSDTRSVGELEDRAESIGPATELGADDATQLAETLVALADAYGNRGEFEAEAATIDRLATVHEHHPETAVQTATALTNATVVADRDAVYETEIDVDRIATLHDRLESLYDERPDESIAVQLARATAQTAHAYGRAEAPASIESLVDQLETLYKTHSTAEIAAGLAEGYAYAERYLDEQTGESRLDRAETLYERHPNDAVAAGLAGVIAGQTNADAGRGAVYPIESRIERIEALADDHPEAGIKRWLTVATANATRASFEVAAYERLEQWGERTNDLHDELGTPESAKWAAAATFYSARGSFFESDVRKGEQKLDRLRALESSFDDQVFEQWLARSMFDATRAYAELGQYENARSMADELETYAVDHEDQAAIEAGLESLRSQAPELFDDSVDTPLESAAGNGTNVPIEQGGTTVESEIDQPDTGASQRSPATGTADLSPDLDESPTASGVRPAGVDETQTAPDESLPGLDERLTGIEEATADSNGGCGSCGPDGCGSCGSQPSTVEPASARAIAAGGVAISLVAVSVLYTLYRLATVARGAIGGDGE